MRAEKLEHWGGTTQHTYWHWEYHTVLSLYTNLKAWQAGMVWMDIQTISNLFSTSNLYQYQSLAGPRHLMFTNSNVKSEAIMDLSRHSRLGVPMWEMHTNIESRQNANIEEGEHNSNVNIRSHHRLVTQAIRESMLANYIHSLPSLLRKRS